LQLVLPDIHISSIESIRTEGTIEAGPDSKSVRLDILCSSENGNYYDIEMQAQDTGELPKRSRYYSSMMDEMQLQHSGMYKELADSYVIFLCSFDPFKRGKYCYVFRSTCVGCPDLELGDGQSRIFLNAAGQMDDVPPALRAFLDYVGGKPAGRSDDSYVQQIDRAVRRAKKNAVWRKQYMDWEMEKKEIEWMALKKGRAEGKAEGKAEVLAENTKTLAAYLKSLDDSLTMEQAMRRASDILQSKDV
ncbi:MAG: Rpn family recombination-promoting nuclease/putative transposase, partial [Lachnospiraceae bacterium]|nr:Rpn family recombination-promoting nuclease/putative transposase [Lachnospiraceae bacterium]